MTDRQVWVLTGGNGAGKSTFYQRFLAPGGLPFINADILARNMDAKNAEALSYDAALMAGRLRSELLARGVSFCFETVFSHPSKIDFIAEAKSRGYQVILIYIHLLSAELNQARVIQRVTEGGHNVPPEKITQRIPRTMQNVKQALPLTDITRFYDNSLHDQPYQPIADVRNHTLTPLVDPLPEWARLMLMDYLV
ncbi:MAG: dephospho-CoA kinase [Gammaproteobacteria bacterium]|nr:dephospho-CoA kinase [Gammaproteobacteria bacterium]MDH5652885.1 dephospho-CoA kinase [Gammaproteobacteria bacterium]